MTSLRQKPKLSFETPVLFRLPDLRVHQAHAVTAWPSAVSPEPNGVSTDTHAQSFRVDPAQSVTPAANSSHAAKSDVTIKSDVAATNDLASPAVAIASAPISAKLVGVAVPRSKTLHPANPYAVGWSDLVHD